MKKLGFMIAALALACGAVFGAQDTSLTIREVRDPRDLKAWLEANAADAQTRFTNLEATAVGYALAAGKIVVGNSAGTGAAVTVSGDITLATNGVVAIGANKILESMLKAVDSASDEDFLSYESTTGDFEWHSAAEVAGKFTEGVLADSIIVTADIKDGEVSEADLKAVDSASDEDIFTYEATTGDFEWHSAAEIQAKFTEGSYADSTIVSADIKDGEVAAADIAADAVGASEIADDAVDKAALLASDFGDFTVGADGTCTIDDNAVGAAEVGSGTLAGDVVVNSTNIEANAVGSSELADDAVTKGSMNAEDFGDFTAGSDGTCTVDSGAITPAKASTGLKTKCAMMNIGGISATDQKYLFVAPYACTIVGVSLLSDTSTATSDPTTNYYSFAVNNLTVTNSLGDAIKTSSSELAGDAAYLLNCTGNLDVAENAVLELSIVKQGSPTSLATAEVGAMVEYY